MTGAATPESHLNEHPLTGKNQKVKHFTPFTAFYPKFQASRPNKIDK